MLGYKSCVEDDKLTAGVTIMILLLNIVGACVTLPYMRMQISESTTFLKAELQLFYLYILAVQNKRSM